MLFCPDPSRSRERESGEFMVILFIYSLDAYRRGGTDDPTQRGGKRRRWRPTRTTDFEIDSSAGVFAFALLPFCSPLSLSISVGGVTTMVFEPRIKTSQPRWGLAFFHLRARSRGTSRPKKKKESPPRITPLAYEFCTINCPFL